MTATSVTVGQIDDLTLPVAGLFKGAEDGTKAYFDYINSKGGVNGRKIILDARDSQYQAGVVARNTTSIIQNDFAMVGGFSLQDSAELPLINQAQMPDVAFPLAVPLSQSPYVYSPAPNPVNDYPVGFMKYLKKKYPQDIKHVGILYAIATPSTQETENGFENAMK
ncbi:MAG: ABC transporter substrate-binding protein, partial [Nitrososphaerales archaeon]